MDVDRHCDVSSSRTKRVTLRGTYFSVDEKEKKEKFHDRIYVPLFRTWIKIDHPNCIYTVFPTKKEGKNFLQRLLSDFSNWFLARSWRWSKSENLRSRRVWSARCPWTVHLFSRSVTLALSDGNNRSGTANWPRGLIATNCMQHHTCTHVRTHRIQLLLAYTATRERGAWSRGSLVSMHARPDCVSTEETCYLESDTRPIRPRNCDQMAIVSRPVIIVKLLQYFPPIIYCSRFPRFVKIIKDWKSGDEFFWLFFLSFSSRPRREKLRSFFRFAYRIIVIQDINYLKV